MEQLERLEDFIAEGTLLELFGVTKGVLLGLRTRRGLPFIRLGKYKRLYRERSLVQWLIEQETKPVLEYYLKRATEATEGL